MPKTVNTSYPYAFTLHEKLIWDSCAVKNTRHYNNERVGGKLGNDGAGAAGNLLHRWHLHLRFGVHLLHSSGTCCLRHSITAPTTHPSRVVDALACLSLLRKVRVQYCLCLLFSGSMKLDSGDHASTEEKLRYELLRDARVAELAAKFRPVQEAAESL